MAGFFGLFNYEKEGPGIDKDGPKKKVFIVFFETFLRNFWKFITVNLVYCLLSLPVLSNGIASIGITNVTRNIARDKHSFGLSDYFDTIRKNWKQALITGILNVLVTVIIAFDIFFFYTGTKGFMSSIGLGICLCLTFIMLIMNFYVWTLIITFKLSLKQIYRNSFRFVFINLWKNILCGLILLAVYAVYVILPFVLPFNIVLTIEILLFILTFPSFRFLLIQFFTFPAIKKYIIDPYYLEHPDEDIERRKDLGIEVEEKVSEEDIVFED